MLSAKQQSTLFRLLPLLVLLDRFRPTPAPVPRCSPLYIINKLAESSNILSDSNPYFPVEPCEYGGPLEALKKGDFKAVFVFANPQNIPLHNFYELIWLLKTGGPRIMRIMNGEEKLIVDNNILNERYQHYTPYVRTKQLGQYTYRNPTIIDDKSLYKRIVGNKIKLLKSEGPDTFINKHYTFQGGVRQQHNNNNGYGHPSGYGPHNREPEQQDYSEEEEEEKTDYGEDGETGEGGTAPEYGQGDGPVYDEDSYYYDDDKEDDGGFQDKKGLPAVAAGGATVGDAGGGVVDRMGILNGQPISISSSESPPLPTAAATIKGKRLLPR